MEEIAQGLHMHGCAQVWSLKKKRPYKQKGQNVIQCLSLEEKVIQNSFSSSADTHLGILKNILVILNLILRITNLSRFWNTLPKLSFRFT